MNSAIYTYLRHLREQKGWSLRKAAEEVGVSVSYISLIEKGVHPNTDKPPKISPEILEKFAAAYEESTGKLLMYAGYIGDQLAFDLDNPGKSRYMTIEESKAYYASNKKISDSNSNDLEDMIEDTDFLTFRGRLIDANTKRKIIDMIDILTND
ncbi:helix-turn-helix domain-containing protein [Paenibacillus sp. FSL M7-0802]|uniref:helix-turn-helix domain-containing protein n=1 Tax=Paenibacillus sp. FSL M7-0802 TaxID=2921536 RepID=UPI0030F86363